MSAAARPPEGGTPTLDEAIAQRPQETSASRTADATEILWLGGFPVRRGRAPDLLRRLLQALDRGEQTMLFFANTNFIVQCGALRRRMLGGNVLIANDGVGLDLAARLVYGKGFVDNLNGTDFVPRLLAAARRPVYLVGARPGVAERAAARLRAEHGVEVAGICDGYTGTARPERLVAAINSSGAEIVLVAMGNPLQEQWILDHREDLGAHLLIGVGALLDFLAGDKPRAPQLIRRVRLEWLYRLCLEPRRLLRRYTVDIVRFLALCLNHGRRGGEASQRP